MKYLRYLTFACPLACLLSLTATSTETMMVTPVSPSTVSTVLAAVSLSESWCDSHRCTVLVTPDEKTRLLQLADAGMIELESIPDARRIMWANAIWDADTGAFDRVFPGEAEVAAPTGPGLFAVVWKSYPSADWISAGTTKGLIFLGPLPTMASLFYGGRAAVSLLRADPRVLGVVEVPAGLKRHNLDSRLSSDGDGPAPTHVMVVGSVAVPTLLGSARPERMATLYGQVRYAPVLSRADAILLSRFPEVVAISRETYPSAPSDERASRLIGGNWSTSGTRPDLGASWAPTFGSNNGIWDRFLSRAASNISGFNLQNQIIGFLDTGIWNGASPDNINPTNCPSYLNPSSCRLQFTADTTVDIWAQNQGLDRWYHGTLTTSIAAGYSLGSDAAGYSFTQGVAQGARVAMAKIFRTANDYQYRNFNGVVFNDTDTERKLRYGLIELGQTIQLEDSSVPSPGVTLFNHSWNSDIWEYTIDAQTMDWSSRAMSYVGLQFDSNYYLGAAAPATHVVSVGNSGFNVLTRSPATAKNVISVGAATTYDAFEYGTQGGSCLSFNGPSSGAQSGWKAGFSCSGSLGDIRTVRVKPDIVAPGTRATGPRSASYNRDEIPCLEDLDGTGNYIWQYGTSFSAAAVSGAAAMVREWRRAVTGSVPSPALTKAILVGAARDLYKAGDPNSFAHTPNNREGFGGLAIDRLFGPASSYFFFDQGFTFVSGVWTWTKDLYVGGESQPVTLTLTWTDALTQLGPAVDSVLVNDLDLNVVSGDYYPNTKYWYGNVYDGAGFSTTYTSPRPVPTRDRKNNVERITIDPATLTSDLLHVTVRVYALNGNALDPGAVTGLNQDFALVALNAHE